MNVTATQTVNFKISNEEQIRITRETLLGLINLSQIDYDNSILRGNDIYVDVPTGPHGTLEQKIYELKSDVDLAVIKLLEVL